MECYGLNGRGEEGTSEFLPVYGGSTFAALEAADRRDRRQMVVLEESVPLSLV